MQRYEVIEVNMYIQWREQVFDTLPILQVFLLTKHCLADVEGEVVVLVPHCQVSDHGTEG